MSVKEELGWVDTFVRLPPSKRKEWVKRILEEIRSYRKRGNPTKETKYLSDLLSDRSKFDLIGFSYNVNYIKVDADDDESLMARWVHPWGSPKLLFKHKKLPILIIAGADIRFNDAITNELRDNPRLDDVAGITG
jgi:hypothetical protein